jgi:hypothetical protein
MSVSPSDRPTVDRRLLVVAAFILPALLLAAVLIAHVGAGLALEEATEDMAQLAGVHPLTGFVSTIGVVLWWSAAIVCLFASAVTVPRDPDGSQRSFLLWSGVITAILALDDLFLFHEDLAQRYLGLGQRHIVIAYATVAALYVARFRSVLRASPERWMLGLSVGLLAASLATDYIHERFIFDRTGEYVGGLVYVEDTLKLLGISAWSAFFIRHGYRAVLASLMVEVAAASPAQAATPQVTPAGGPASVAPPGARRPPPPAPRAAAGPSSPGRR